MAEDNMTTELDGPKPEKQLNTQSELDPKSVVTFVYRGENPYMRFLAKGLQAQGVPVNMHEVSTEAYDGYINSLGGASIISGPDALGGKLYSIPQAERAKLLEPLLGSAPGIVVTDATLALEGKMLFRDKFIPGYSALKESMGSAQAVVEKISPVIEQIQAVGKKPVILPAALADHMPGITEEERQPLKPVVEQLIGQELSDNEYEHLSRKSPDIIYTAFFKAKFGIPVISNADFSNETTNIPSVLRNMGLDPNETVLLIDHHLYYMKKEKVSKKGLGEVEVVRICPCCLAKGRPNEDPSEKLRVLGFKLFPAYIEPDNKAVDKLVEMVDQKRATLAAQEAFSPQS